jgi:hypothetical protein
MLAEPWPPGFDGLLIRGDVLAADTDTLCVVGVAVPIL